jgi:hypothetical protein
MILRTYREDAYNLDDVREALRKGSMLFPRPQWGKVASPRQLVSRDQVANTCNAK